jgi:hypothetical protein
MSNSPKTKEGSEMKTIYLEEPKNIETRSMGELAAKKYFEVYMLPESVNFLKGFGLAVILSVPIWLILLIAYALV